MNILLFIFARDRLWLNLVCSKTYTYQKCSGIFLSRPHASSDVRRFVYMVSGLVITGNSGSFGTSPARLVKKLQSKSSPNAQSLQAHGDTVAKMPPKGASTKIVPMRLPPLGKLKVRRPNDGGGNPCLPIMSAVLSMCFPRNERENLLPSEMNGD
jgi:hypothetical protein